MKSYFILSLLFVGFFSCAFFSFNLSATTISTKTNNKILVVQSSSSSKGNIIGIWRDDYDTKILHRIRKDKNKDEPGKWVDYTSLREQYLNGFRVFFDKNHTEEYYIVEKNGDLSVFDNFGFIGTYIRIKIK